MPSLGEGTAGPVAVLLHGGPGMSATYLDPLTDLLGDVFSTVSYQQRGLPPTTIRVPYTVEANVADAAAVIDQVATSRCTCSRPAPSGSRARSSSTRSAPISRCSRSSETP